MSITIIIYAVVIALALVFSLLINMLYHAFFNKTSFNPLISVWIFGIILFGLFLYWM
jgi:hypothetical protein